MCGLKCASFKDAGTPPTLQSVVNEGYKLTQYSPSEKPA